MYNKPEMALRQAAKNIKKREGNGHFSLPIVAMALAILFFIGQNISLVGKNGVLSKKDEQITKDLLREQEKNKNLKEEQSRLFSHDYEEELIREKAMYKKSGEKIIHVSGLKDAKSANASSSKDANNNNFDLAATIWEDFKKIFQK
jgi:hypothetical protein